MVASNESLTSLNSAAAHHKNHRIKYFEAKVEELGVLLRQKDLSIEASNKEINRLRTDLGSILSKAEANLAAVDRLSEEVIAQKDEQHRKAIQELECAKKHLANLEEEIGVLRSQLAEKVAEIENLSLQLDQLSKEVEAKNMALEKAEELRLKIVEDQSFNEKKLRKLEGERDAAEMEVKDLTTELNKLKEIVSRQEREALEALDRVQAAQAEAEKASIEARNASLRASARESDLKDRVRLLEDRLVLLTEPSSDVFTEQIGEIKLTSCTLPSLDSLEAASERCVTLLVERKLLETRLAEIRKNLEEVKSTMGEKIADLESQVTHLNNRIFEDSAEYASQRAEWESQRQKLESELIEFRDKQLESEQTSQKLIQKEQHQEQEMTHASLKAEIVVMQQSMQTDDRMHAEVLHSSQELQLRVSDLEKDVENSVKEANSLKNENEELKIQLDAEAVKIAELQQLNSQHRALDRLNCEKVNSSLHVITKLEQELRELSETNADLRADMARLTQTQERANEADVTQSVALKEKLATTEAELAASAKRVDDAQKLANTADVKCHQLQSERDALCAKLAEMENDFQSRLAELERKRKEFEAAHSFTEVASLKASIDELNEVISDRNKTIRLQKQKLSELKRALGQGLKPVAVSNLSLISTDEEVHNHHQSAFVSGAAGSGALGGPSLAVDEVTLPPLFASTHQAPSTSPPAILPAMETPQSLDSHCAPTVLSAAPPATASLTNSQYDADPINFEYMRHVLLKFFLSHDAEALQLVRVVATVLKLSKKDEFLIRQRLEERLSWFATPVVLPESSGQFAKMVSH
ncbi:unnamed protein product [Hydatigera taeniaeformis]|uniref:GRIP domain-containing protein n=1 Tax=Hydatigena taeniaeformis TaxID=6205 RepID=A0A0R3X329_HYDTA|nr:unnamed protein product [Hydatigera taeniaeformis]